MRRPSVRARLALWHAATLALVVAVFAAAIFLFVRARLYRALDGQLALDLASVERVYIEEVGELPDLDHRLGLHFFQVREGETVAYQTPSWPPPASYRMGTRLDGTRRITVARDDGAVRDALRALVVTLAMAGPGAIALAVAGGYLLAGRVLAPVGSMAATARKISADALGERLSVENPDDEFGRLAGVFNDTLDRLQKAFEQLRQFTADASHELRTPLTAMRSVGEVALQRPQEAGRYREVIGSMLEEVDRLTRLVENLLTLTRAEAGRIPLVREPVDVDALASGVAEQLRVLSEEKDQALTVDAAAAVRVDADPTVLRRALVNVLDNAIKYTPANGSIRVVTRRAPGGHVVMEVIDTGPGIAPGHRDRIFERFYRIDAGRSRDAGGEGLGLALARWAVEVHGGRLEVDSDQGQGSVFRIVLPLLPPA